jgi:hypothetical protein
MAPYPSEGLIHWLSSARQGSRWIALVMAHTTLQDGSLARTTRKTQMKIIVRTTRRKKIKQTYSVMVRANI